MTTTRLALFDLDDTLFAHRAAVSGGIRAYLQTLGRPYDIADPATADALWHQLEEEHYHSYLTGTLDYDGQRRERARDFAAAQGVTLADDDALAWYAAYFEHYVDNWVLHDDALPCLDQLERDVPGIQIGLITNGPLEYQSRKIDRVGLSSRVEHVITSGAFGIAKPDAAIFAHACAVFDVPTASAAYVGDRLRTDAIGASLAGLRGIWLNRTRRQMTQEEALDARAAGVREIRSLAELPPLLAR